MKHIIYIAIFFISAFSYTQETVAINGKVLDFESNSAPLMLAKLSIKETGAKATTNEKGFFKFENLKPGNYTLISSFVGYDTKETKVTINTNTTTIKLVLEPSTISLEDLIATMDSADNTASSKTNN